MRVDYTQPWAIYRPISLNLMWQKYTKIRRLRCPNLLDHYSFGWMKDIGLMRKLSHRGKKLVNQLLLFTDAAYNLVRMRRLLA